MRCLHTLPMGGLALLLLDSNISGASPFEGNRECDSCHVDTWPEGDPNDPGPVEGEALSLSVIGDALLLRRRVP